MYALEKPRVYKIEKSSRLVLCISLNFESDFRFFFDWETKTNAKLDVLTSCVHQFSFISFNSTVFCISFRQLYGMVGGDGLLEFISLNFQFGHRFSCFLGTQ